MNCLDCNAEIGTSACTRPMIVLSGHTVERRPFADQTETACPGCGTPVGGIHHYGCPQEQCPSCFGQLTHCACTKNIPQNPAAGGVVLVLRNRKMCYEAGAQALADELPVTTEIYGLGVPFTEWWINGWWQGFYRRKERDRQSIARWLTANVHAIPTEEAALVVAELFVNSEGFDREKPIRGNVIGPITFDVPAPASLD